MKYLIFVVLLFTSITDPVTRIAKSNALKKEAKKAYDKGNYDDAIVAYGELIDSLNFQDDNAKMNLANALYFVVYGKDSSGNYKNLELMSTFSDKNKLVESLSGKDLDESRSYTDNALKIAEYGLIGGKKYDELKSSKDLSIASSAYNQKGIINYKQSEIAEAKDKKTLIAQALEDFKNSIRKNPGNESARYNYELLKKLIRQQEQKDQKDQKDENKEEDKKNDKEEDVKPSDYAKLMKSKSDALKAKGQFKEALKIMEEALSKDKTTKAYKEYIQKLEKVAAI